VSASPAGKFQDHYHVLGVPANSTTETIHAAYSQLARKFHPNNKETADAAKFQAVTQAYEVLADPSARAAFDSVRSGPSEDGPPRFSGQDFFSGLDRFLACRQSVLSILYDRRWSKPRTPGLSVRQLETMMAIPSEQLQFIIWYLKQKGWVVADDKSNLSITVAGMDVTEANPPKLETIQELLKQD